ncbi:MAG: single-stranded DNA-binding protein [Candidatus Brennerbacteria bacterium]|nr:single-stranded DNA-binding protein [Candidatus Brennerbacteria bacterium]
MNLNKVFLIGRLTADPQLRTTTGGQSVASFGIATNRVWTDKQGQKQEDVQFHNVVVWGRQAEITSQFLKKGSMAMVEGRLQNRSWQDKQGQNRTTTEIVCERMQFGPRAAGGFGETNPRASGAPYAGEQKNTISAQGVDELAHEALPEINLDEGDIRPENIPF